MDIFVPFPIYTSFAGVFLLMPSSHHKLLSSQPKPMSLTSALLQSLMDNIHSRLSNWSSHRAPHPDDVTF